MNPYDPEQFQKAIDEYRDDRESCDKATALRRQVGLYMLDQRRRGTTLAGIGPGLGVLDAIAMLHTHDFNWIARGYIKLLRYALRPHRPGWNDYWMARWMCTHHLSCCAQMHDRAAGHTCTQWPYVIESAAWMVRSTRERDSFFDGQMKQIEEACALCNPKLPAYPAA